jgi:hypothetical protein
MTESAKRFLFFHVASLQHTIRDEKPGHGRGRSHASSMTQSRLLHAA